MWMIAIALIIFLTISVFLLYVENEEKKQTISNLRQWAKQSKTTYISMFGKLKRRNWRIERLEKQIKIGAIWKPVK